jgi:hypothetical protein
MTHNKTYDVTLKWTARRGPFAEHSITLTMRPDHRNGPDEKLVSPEVCRFLAAVSEAVTTFEAGGFKDGEA